MKANLKAAVLAGKYGGEEDEKRKKEEATKQAINKTQSSGTASNVAGTDTSASASIYYRGYDKNNREVRINQEDMPQSDDEKTKLAWKHGVRSWSKITEADADTKKTPEPKEMPPQTENKRSFVGGGYIDPNEELKKERFKFKR